MRFYLSSITSVLLAGLIALFSVSYAGAAPKLSGEQIATSVKTSDLLKLAGYYDRDYDDDYYEDDHYRPRPRCKVRYKKKYVCERDEPRCFKQRECIWHYGKEYCRYVRKCVGGNKYCKWVSTPVRSCGCRDCW